MRDTQHMLRQKLQVPLNTEASPSMLPAMKWEPTSKSQSPIKQ